MKKIFKKIIVSCLSLIMVISASIFLTACGEDRSAILKLYVPGEYISQEVISGFENWYFEQTGSKITVEKTEFDTNETMYTMVATKHVDYDVICPSDYMLERMKKEGLLVKVKTEAQEVVKDRFLGDENQNEDLYNIVTSFDENFEYTVPYMWGTMGIMYYYDSNDMSAEETANVINADNQKSTWTALFDNAPNNSIYMKDSYRDTYTVALLNYYHNSLSDESAGFTNYTSDNYKTLLESFFVKGTNAEFSQKVQNAKTTLENQKSKVYKYEVDDGKDDLITNHTKYGMFWSCDAGYIMADFSGDEVVYTENFRYIVPKEGSNVWIDSFCIPKYAKNQDAANLFMLYITNPDVAFSCMDYAGCTSAIYETTEAYYEYLNPAFLSTYSLEDIDNMSEEDLLANGIIDENGEYTFDTIFASCSDAFKSNYLSLMFPNKDITVGDYTILSPLSRCGVMRDLGAQANDQLATMWSLIKKG